MDITPDSTGMCQTIINMSGQTEKINEYFSETIAKSS